MHPFATHWTNTALADISNNWNAQPLSILYAGQDTTNAISSAKRVTLASGNHRCDSGPKDGAWEKWAAITRQSHAWQTEVQVVNILYHLVQQTVPLLPLTDWCLRGIVYRLFHHLGREYVCDFQFLLAKHTVLLWMHCSVTPVTQPPTVQLATSYNSTKNHCKLENCDNC